MERYPLNIFHEIILVKDEIYHSKTDVGKEGEAATTSTSKDDAIEKSKKKKREKIEQIETMQKSLAICLVRCRKSTKRWRCVDHFEL